MKSGFIGIVGRPNVGKSTLLNAILGEKVAIISEKPQTTRNSIRGIYTREEGSEEGGVQMVFIDTPGIHRPKNRLGSYMTDKARDTLREVDVILLVVDGPFAGPGSGDAFVLDLLKETHTRKILVINKIDRIDPQDFQRAFEAYEALGLFDAIVGTQAKEGRNVPALLAAIEDLLPQGPMYFPADMVTDHPERFLVSEIIREKALLFLSDEVPHGVAVDIEQYQETPGLIRIGAVIYCEKKSHKGILIGKGGKKLKGIGKSARLELEALLGAKVFLELWVKVRENWRENQADLRRFGYGE